MSPDELRALADTVAWQDRTDLYSAIVGAADELERMESALRAFVADHGKRTQVDGFYVPSPRLVGSCSCEACREAWAILRRMDKARGKL